MSIRVMAAVWELQDLSSNQKLVLLAMADHADDTGFCFPGQERLAFKTGLSERSVRRIQKELTDLGYLDRLARGGRIGDQGWSARWRVQPDTLSGDPQADTDEPQPDTRDTPTGHQTRPNRTDDPPKRQGTTSGIVRQNRERERDLLWETFVQVHGEPASKGERGKYNKAVGILREAGVEPGEYPQLILAFKHRYPKLHPAVMTVAQRVGELRHHLDRGPIRQPTRVDETAANVRAAIGDG